uniref:Uncharacterized protein n=1 Tax=Apteryx owenii TaxID=8824 RepID=A0A8B9QTW5_APTOW
MTPGCLSPLGTWAMGTAIVCGARLGHCSAGPGLHPRAAEHPHLPPAGECSIPVPGRSALSAPSRSLGPSSLQTTCSCRRKSHGKLDLFSTKDSYHPMAEYPTYQSHGRYASPTSKHNPYSQVRGRGAAPAAGTFTYTNPAAGSDNL